MTEQDVQKPVIGLDTNPAHDPDRLYANQRFPLPEDLDPAKAATPMLRSLMISARRQAGLTDYPTSLPTQRSAAD